MHKNRLEAFSDGVLAIIITIMVLELKVPHGVQVSDLVSMGPIFISYLISFIYIGIYWNNHHHLFQAAKQVNGAVLWANLHLLFWLSLVPWVTAWAGENHFAELPVGAYGFVLMMAGVAYYILSQNLISLHGKESVLAAAVGRDRKGKLSIVIYAVAIALVVTGAAPWISSALYVLVAILWLVPDPRITHALNQEH